MKLHPLIAALILVSPAALAEETASFDLLNKRIAISMPKGAKAEARGHSIMGAPESNESETRIVFQDGEKKMVVMAWELFKSAGANYTEEVPKALKEWSESEATPFKISKVSELVTAGIPEKPNADDEAILHAAAFVRHKDDSIQRIAIYFNEEFNKTPARCTELASMVLTSVNSGERSLNLRAGNRQLNLLNSGSHLVINVPDGWTYTTKEGVDFMVHTLEEVSDFGTTSSSIGIYLGGHPGYHHSRIDEDTLVKRTRQAPLFGKSKDWIEYSTKEEKDWTSIEIISGLPGMDDTTQTHIFTGASDAKRLDELLKIIATTKIEPAKKK